MRKRSSLIIRNANYWDWLAALTFLAFAVLFFLGCLEQNYPHVILTGDGGNIASYAAAQDHPGWYKNDPALSNSNAGIYATIHIPLIRVLNLFTGDYSLAFACLVLPETFLQLLGFYFLGRVIFNNRFWAYLLAFITAMTVRYIGLGEIWGVWQDALPRVTFQSLLPFLLALNIIWKDRPRRWPWLMIFAGLLVYVHPISAPAWGFAIWLSLWLFQPSNWSWRRRFIVMVGLGILFLLAVLPFAINYLSYNGRSQAADFNTVMTVLQVYSPGPLLDPFAILGYFLRVMTGRLLIPVALAGFVAVWILQKSERTIIKIVTLWMTGIFITSILIPFGERIIEQQFHILPIETELVRCFRYFIPMLLLFWLWPLATLTSSLRRPHAKMAVIIFGIALSTFWVAKNSPNINNILNVARCSEKGHLICVSKRPIDGLITALRIQTQPGDGVLFYTQDPADTSLSISIRYTALRPLVYTERDNGILSYANRPALSSWLETTKQLEVLRAMPDPRERLDGLINLAERLKADYLIIDFSVTPEDLSNFPAKVVMRNDTYILFKLP